MTIGYTIGKLQALKAAVLADGKIDWAGTDALLAAARAARRPVRFRLSGFRAAYLEVPRGWEDHAGGI